MKTQRCLHARAVRVRLSVYVKQKGSLLSTMQDMKPSSLCVLCSVRCPLCLMHFALFLSSIKSISSIASHTARHDLCCIPHAGVCFDTFEAASWQPIRLLVRHRLILPPSYRWHRQFCPLCLALLVSETVHLSLAAAAHQRINVLHERLFTTWTMSRPRCLLPLLPLSSSDILLFYCLSLAAPVNVDPSRRPTHRLGAGGPCAVVQPWLLGICLVQRGVPAHVCETKQNAGANRNETRTVKAAPGTAQKPP